MNCQRCKSDRVISLSAKCSDLCITSYKDHEKDGYIPDLGHLLRDYAYTLLHRSSYGDYLCPDICLECGQTQGQFPLPDPDFSGC